MCTPSGAVVWCFPAFVPPCTPELFWYFHPSPFLLIKGLLATYSLNEIIDYVILDVQSTWKREGKLIDCLIKIKQPTLYLKDKCKLKKFSDPIRNRPVTLWLVVQCLAQIHHCMLMMMNDYNTNNSNCHTVTNKCRHFVGITVTITITMTRQQQRSQ